MRLAKKTSATSYTPLASLLCSFAGHRGLPVGLPCSLPGIACYLFSGDDAGLSYEQQTRLADMAVVSCVRTGSRVGENLVLGKHHQHTPVDRCLR